MGCHSCPERDLMGMQLDSFGNSEGFSLLTSATHFFKELLWGCQSDTVETHQVFKEDAYMCLIRVL